MTTSRVTLLTLALLVLATVTFYSRPAPAQFDANDNPRAAAFTRDEQKMKDLLIAPFEVHLTNGQTYRDLTFLSRQNMIGKDFMLVESTGGKRLLIRIDHIAAIALPATPATAPAEAK